MAGRRPTKAKRRDEGARWSWWIDGVTVEVRELGAEVEPLGLRAEAESGPWRLEAEVRDNSSPGDAGGWQTHGARTVQMGG